MRSPLIKHEPRGLEAKRKTGVRNLDGKEADRIDLSRGIGEIGNSPGTQPRKALNAFILEFCETVRRGATVLTGANIRTRECSCSHRIHRHRTDVTRQGVGRQITRFFVHETTPGTTALHTRRIASRVKIPSLLRRRRISAAVFMSRLSIHCPRQRRHDAFA